MKRCPKCDTEKPTDEFWKSRRHADGFQTYCKLCSTARRIKHYQDNRERESGLRDSWNRAYRDWFASLKDGPCSDCAGRFHPAAMHWHHLPGAVKTHNVSQMVSRRMKKTTVLAEIAKCELLCANCHAVRTWGQTGRSLVA